jgi:hypothetical protein
MNLFEGPCWFLADLWTSYRQQVNMYGGGRRLKGRDGISRISKWMYSVPMVLLEVGFKLWTRACGWVLLRIAHVTPYVPYKGIPVSAAGCQR